MSTASPSPTTTSQQMPTVPQYCEDPSKYKDRVPEQYRPTFDSACEMLREMKAQDEYDQSSEGKREKIGQNFAVLFRDLPYMITVGQVSDPSQLSMFLLTDETLGLVRFRGFFERHSQQLWKSTANEMKRFGYSWVKQMSTQGGKIITKAGTQALQRGYGRYLLNSVALNGAIRTGMQQTINRLIGNVARGSVRVFVVLIRLLASFAATGMAIAIRALAVMNFLFMVSMVMMLVGMVVDTLDPCGMNKALDAQSIQAYAEGMDDMFRQQIIPNETAFYANGEYKYYAKWPIDVRVERLFPMIPRSKKETGDEDAALKEIEKRRLLEFGITESRRDELISLRMEYEFLYLYNLKFNSYGQPLVLSPEIENAPDLSPQMMQVMGEYYVNQFANNNPVVSKWLVRYSPLILTVIALVLFLIFKYV